MNSPAAIRAIPSVAWAVVAFTAWRSLPLLDAWRHSPLDRTGWIAFLLWSVPLAVALFAPVKTVKTVDSIDSVGRANPAGPIPTAALTGSAPRAAGLVGAAGWLLGTGLAIAVLGTLGDFNSACYAGLALTLTAVTLALRAESGWSVRHALWLAAALAWMPALSWLAKSLPSSALAVARLVLAAIGAAPLALALLRPPRPR